MADPMPNPGSPAAIARKCRCGVLDNHYGQGAYTDANGKTHFWISGDCRLHAEANEPTPKDSEMGDLFA